MKKTQTSRRGFIKTSLAASAAYPIMMLDTHKSELDFHIHFVGNINIEAAVNLAKKQNIKVGIVEHLGSGQAIRNNNELERYIELLSNHPIYIGIKPIHTGWAKNLSQELISKVDYVVMDALTIPSGKGQYDKVWKPEFRVENKNKFMDTYMKHAEQILTKERIDIFSKATFLPHSIINYYDELWTEGRMQTVIDIAKHNNIAIEINETLHLPNDRFIRMGKDSGLKFTFGFDAVNHYNNQNYAYCQQVSESFGLKEGNMFILDKAI